MKHTLRCECGRKKADFNFRDNIMPPEIIKGLYCPACSGEKEHDPGTMLPDNGWVIQYDMELAGMHAAKMPSHAARGLTPEVLFDEGYATWLGVYPGDLDDNAEERSEILALAKKDPREYFDRMRTWAICRMDRLRNEGWRKAQEG